MTPLRFSNYSGIALILAGSAYILDTALDELAPGSAVGLGALVPFFGLVGFPAFWMTLRPPTDSHFAVLVFVLVMIGIAGLAPVTFLVNRVLPEMTPDAAMAILASVRLEFIVIGSLFLISALLLLVLAWRSDWPTRLGAGLFALGAIPVALPPLMPPQLVTAGGLLVASALLLWGYRLLKAPSADIGAAYTAGESA